MMFDIIGKRFWFFLISGVLILMSIVSLATVGLKSGIEFSSGSMLTVKFEQPVDYTQFKQEMSQPRLRQTPSSRAPARASFSSAPRS